MSGTFARHTKLISINQPLKEPALYQRTTSLKTETKTNSPKRH